MLYKTIPQAAVCPQSQSVDISTSQSLTIAFFLPLSDVCKKIHLHHIILKTEDFYLSEEINSRFENCFHDVLG